MKAEITSNSLNKLIIPSEGAVAPSEGRRSVIFDAKSRQILERVPALGFFRDIRIFRVSTYDDITQQGLQAEQLTRISLHTSGAPGLNPVELSVKAWCRVGNEADLVRQLMERPDFSAQESLGSCADVAIRTAVAAFIAQHSRRSCDAVQLPSDLAKAVCVQLEASLPLLGWEVRGSWGCFMRCEDLKVEASLRPKDAAKPLKAGFLVQVKPLDQIEFDSISALKDVPAAQERIAALLTDDIRDHWDSAEFRLAFDPALKEARIPSTSTDLLARLNVSLALHGLKADSILLDGAFPQADSASVPVGYEPKEDIEVRIRLKERNEALMLKTHVRLTLQAPAKYLQAGSPPLEGWTASAVENAVKDAARDMAYVDFISHFPEQQAKITSQVARKAEGIGYLATLLVTEPDSEDYKLMTQTFAIDLPAAGSGGEVGSAFFPTKQSEVSVALVISLRAQLKDLKAAPVLQLLKRGQCVKTHLRERIQESIRQLMLGVDPEEFYKYFETGKNAREKPLQQKLVNEVRSILQEVHAAPGASVVINPGKTELTACIHLLQSAPMKLSVSVENKLLAEPVRVAATATVSGIAFADSDSGNGMVADPVSDPHRRSPMDHAPDHNLRAQAYQAFARRLPTPDVVRDELQDALQAQLSVMDPRDIYVQSELQQGAFKAKVQQILRDAALSLHGLDIVVAIADRKKTAHEADVSLLESERLSALVNEERRKLTHGKALGDLADAAELRSLEKMQTEWLREIEEGGLTPEQVASRVAAIRQAKADVGKVRQVGLREGPRRLTDSTPLSDPADSSEIE